MLDVRETLQNGATKAKKMLLVRVTKKRMLHIRTNIFPALRPEHSRRRMELAALRAARRQLHRHEHGHVFGAEPHQQRRHSDGDLIATARLPAALPAVQLGVHPLYIPGGCGDVPVQRHRPAVPTASGQHRARGTGSQCWSGVLNILHDGGEQHVSTNETDLRKRNSCMNLALYLL